MVKVREDLTGKTFGRLLVIEQAEDYINPQGTHYANWLCECQCNKHTKLTVLGTNLKGNKSTSCGCKTIEWIKNNCTKTNVYDLESKEYGIGYTSKGEEFWFDKEDYDLIKNYYWYYDKYGYLMSKREKKYVRLHALIMNPPKGQLVDHIVHKKTGEHNYDNRKSNLRIVNKSQNGMNSTIKKNNTSGMTGVSYDKKRSGWVAQIKKGSIQKSKTFKTFEEAVAMRKQWEEELFGEYSFDNSQAIN